MPRGPSEVRTTSETAAPGQQSELGKLGGLSVQKTALTLGSRQIRHAHFHLYTKLSVLHLGRERASQLTGLSLSCQVPHISTHSEPNERCNTPEMLSDQALRKRLRARSQLEQVHQP